MALHQHIRRVGRSVVRALRKPIIKLKSRRPRKAKSSPHVPMHERALRRYKK